MTNLDDAAIHSSDPELGGQRAKRVERFGFAIVHDVIGRESCSALIDEIDRIEAQPDIDYGKNDCEGFRTRRIFNLIARGPRFREIVLNEEVLGAAEAVLDPVDRQHPVTLLGLDEVPERVWDKLGKRSSQHSEP